MSLPLGGPSAVAGREVLLGVELARAQHSGDVELLTLDSFAADRDEQALANATRAAEDGAALAYIGDFHSSQVMATAPVLGLIVDEAIVQDGYMNALTDGYGAVVA